MLNAFSPAAVKRTTLTSGSWDRRAKMEPRLIHILISQESLVCLNTTGESNKAYGLIKALSLAGRLISTTAMYCCGKVMLKYSYV